MKPSRCLRCGRNSTVPLLDRPRCECGSVCWYTGKRPVWPPLEAPAFLAGTFPGGEATRLLAEDRYLGEQRKTEQIRSMSEMPLFPMPGVS